MVIDPTQRPESAARPTPSASAPTAASEAARPSSQLPGFYRRSLEERHAELERRGLLTAEEVALLRSHRGGLALETADKMVENLIGVLELPLGLGSNFLINGKDYVVPMAIEEPSVVAAVSHIAKLTRASGGFSAHYEADIMIGQVQVVGCEDFEEARRQVLSHKQELVDLANAFEPNMVCRGGGAKDIEVRLLDNGRYQKMLVVHLLIDCCDAMGANLINTMAEGIAPRVEELTKGTVFLRILSNLADRRLVKARCRIPFAHLGWKDFDGEQVARGIELASQFAELDPYRATTHNKGIMNGISAVCIATGNDWRALEAGAHAYCCRDGQYRPMATWWIEEGHLVGELCVPIQVGTVGGPIKLHPTVQLVHRMMGIESAGELAKVMGAVGLAQNMAAVKALATTGIQRGHMSLHARSVAATAGASDEELELLVARLIEDGEIKLHRAQELLEAIRQER